MFFNKLIFSWELLKLEHVNIWDIKFEVIIVLQFLLVAAENLVLVSLLCVKYFKYICALLKLLMFARMFMLTLFSTEEKVKNWNIIRCLMEVYD